MTRGAIAGDTRVIEISRTNEFCNGMAQITILGGRQMSSWFSRDRHISRGESAIMATFAAADYVHVNVSKKY